VDAAVTRALAEARALGFLGPGPLEAHEASADAFADALGPVTGRVLDLGSGGGVPGLLLAARYDQVAWVLLDGNRRRTSFLARAVAELGWAGRVEVVRSPAETAAHRPELRSSFAAVVARSFGPPPVTAECAVGFLQLGGRLLVSEPPEERADRWPADGLRSLGLTAEQTGAPVAVFQLAELPAPTVPRSWQKMERHPAW
jgi:16S rRNA (guanine527-N7)-methyltransferase